MILPILAFSSLQPNEGIELSGMLTDADGRHGVGNCE